MRSPAREAEVDLLAAAARSLSDQGYEIILEPNDSLVPDTLRGLRPDAIAIGRSPRLFIEVASERPEDARRVATLQRSLKAEPDWKLHLVLNRASNISEVAKVSEAEIDRMPQRILDVSTIDPRAALLLCWATLEASSRARHPIAFARPQTPSRIVERLAAEGAIAASQAAFLRSMAEARNAFAHGDLLRSVTAADVMRFVEFLREFIEPAPVD